MCGMEFGLTEDARFNARAFRSVEQRAQGKLTGQEIRSLRKKIGITQEMAGKLFGGGPVAFCKYEKDDLSPSEPMDNLLWLIQQFPGLVVHLASRNGVDDVSASKGLNNLDVAGTSTMSGLKEILSGHLYSAENANVEAREQREHIASLAKGSSTSKKADVQEDSWSRSGKFPYLAQVAHPSNVEEPMNDEIFEMTRRLVGAKGSWMKSPVRLAS